MRGFCSKLSAPSSFLSTHFGWGWQEDGKVDKHWPFQAEKQWACLLSSAEMGATWRKRAEHLVAANVYQRLAFFCSSMETCSPSELERHHLKLHTHTHTHEGVHYQYFLSWQYKEKRAKHGLPGKMPCVRHPAGSCRSAGMLQVGLNLASKLPVPPGATGKRAFTC